MQHALASGSTAPANRRPASDFIGEMLMEVLWVLRNPWIGGSSARGRT